MKIRFIRNCTMIIEYGGKKFLVDPMFRAKGAVEKLGPTLYPEKPPLTDLPVAPEEIMNGVDAVLLTHLHPGHFDQAAGKLIPQTIPFYVQNLNDKDYVRAFGASKNQTINMTMWTHLEDIDIIRIEGRHGTGKIMHVINTMQNSSGIVLRKKGEKTIYITGDTIWYPGMFDGLGYKPDLIIAYLGASVGEGMRLTMDTDDLDELQKAAPKAKIMCVHMDTFENQTLSRNEVRSFAEQNGFADRLIIPENGETVDL
ncbi:MAG: MBL fold metallo-hydrolase [Eubacterium sp.]|nr:MBL fold metallo-hydrolase [Eubacterium sp.]